MSAPKQTPKSYLEDTQFLSQPNVTEAEFVKDYRRVYQGKPRAKELYFAVVTELKKAVLDGNFANFQHLTRLFDYIHGLEGPTVLKSFCSPTTAINFVILACEHNRSEILDYTFLNSKIFENLSIITGKDTIVPGDKDDTCHDAFYYAIRSGNVKILDLLITKWPGNYFTTRSLELDEILSRAYEQLKLLNVSLSGEMKIYVENELLNLRFFSDRSGQVQIAAKDVLRCISERIDLVLKNIVLLNSEYSNKEKIDSKFLLVSRFIAHNIHILKRQLKLTYDRVPWEEMEFFLVAFLSSILEEEQQINIFYRTVLNKNKLLLYLKNFAKTLTDFKPSMTSLNVSKLAALPKLNREKVVEKIICDEPGFLQFYDDYQQIRDIHSLERINDYLNMTLSADPKEREGQLIITRTLQVIGEYFKNTLESPKLSSNTSERLLLSLPKNTRKIVIDLRNSLSHTHSLLKRTEIYENSNVNFFIGIQNDIKQIESVIVDIFYIEKIKIIEVLLKKIIGCDRIDEIKAIAAILKRVEPDKLLSQDFKMTAALDKIEKLVQQLSDTITEQSDYEKELFIQINTMISDTKTKSDDIKAGYSATFQILQALPVMLRDKNVDQFQNTIREMKSYAEKVLERFFPQFRSHSLKNIVDLVVVICGIALSRKPNDNLTLDTMGRLGYEMSCIVNFEINKIKSVEKLRKQLREKNSSIPASNQTNIPITKKNKFDKQLTDNLSELKNILTKGSWTKKLIDYKKNKKLQAVVEMLVLDIISILGESGKYLENNLFFLDDNTALLTGKSLRNHLAHGNILLDVLLCDPSLDILLNAEKLVSANIIQNKKKIGKVIKDDPAKLNDKFNQDLLSITNQQNMFAALAAGNRNEFEICLKEGADINAKSIDSLTTLHFAAQGPNLELVNFIINENVSINAKDKYRQTVFHVAAAHGRKDIIEFFSTQDTTAVNDPDENDKTPLHIAAENGQLDIVEILLGSDANTDVKDLICYSPLHYAAKCNHLEVVKVLLKKEKSVDAHKAGGGITSLHIAAQFGSLAVVNFLLNNGADVDAKSDENETPLHSASRYGHHEVVSALLCKRATVNATAINGFIPLHYAAESGQEKVADILLKNNAEVNAVTKIYHNTPLYYAAKNGHEKIVEYLLEKKADPNMVTKEGHTSPLHLASQNGHLSIVASLLKHDADIHAKESTPRNNTALHLATNSGHKEIVQLLINHGANVHDRNGTKSTPLLIAASQGYREIVDLLIKKGAKHSDGNSEGCTPLIAAAENGNEDVMKILLDDGAQIDATTHQGLTPLHVTARHGHHKATVLLIERNADVNSKSNNGFRPLHEASSNGHKEIALSLLESTAIQVNAESNSGRTPLHVAVDAGYKDLVEILITSGANVNPTNKSFLPLTSAVWNNNKELVEILIEKGADVNANQGEAIALAVVSGAQDIVEFLLRKGARVDFEGPEGETPLHLASARGHVEIADALIAIGAAVDVITASGSPLLVAAESGHAQIADVLLKNGTTVDINTSLRLSASRGHVDFVNVLLHHGADIDAKDDKGKTALEYAVENGHLPVVKKLEEHKQANLQSQVDTDGASSLFIAAGKNNLELVKHLVESGSADINAKNNFNSKCIHIAAAKGFQDAVEYFLDKGMDINDPGMMGQTPLHYGIVNKQVQLVKYLISKGADVNSKDENDLTPIHIAATQCREDIVKLLLENGAVFNPVNNFTQTPLVSMENVGGKGINLKEKKYVINLLSSTEKLFKAVKQNSSSDVKKFIKAGAFINAKNTNMGTTPLHYAAWKGHQDILNILLENKANPNLTSDLGFSALHYAAKFSHLECVKALMWHGAIYNIVSKTDKTPVALTNNTDIINLFKITDDLFKKIGNHDRTVIRELSKVNSGTLKAIMNARNSENQCLIAAASQSNFQFIEEMKHVSQGDSSSQLKTALDCINQGDYQRSVNILERLLERRKQILGINNPATLEMETYLAKSLNRRGDYQRASDLLDEIFSRQKETLGMDNPLTLDTRSEIALVMHHLGKDKEAIDIYRDVYKRQTKILGEDSDAAQSTLFCMPLVLHRLGEYDEALKTNLEVLKNCKKTFGMNNMNTISCQHNMAMILNSQGKSDEALKIYEEVLERKTKLVGINHADTLRTKQSIASILVQQKKFQEGLTTYKEVLNAQKKILQQNHSDILNTRYNMANVLFFQGEFVSAYKFFKKVYDQGRVIFGSDNETVLDAHSKMEFIKNYKLKLEGFDLDAILLCQQNELIKAAAEGDVQTVEHHLQNEIDVDTADIDGRTLLHFAASNGHLELVNHLLKNGALVTVATKKGGNTSLHLAASKNYVKIVRVLLEHVDHYKVNDFIDFKTTSSGMTSLHVAAKGGYLEIVKLLLKSGATYNIPNKEGKTPVSLSTDQKTIELFKLIDELFKLVKEGSIEAMNKLNTVEPDEFAAVTNARCTQGHTLLQVAIENKHENISVALWAMLNKSN